MKKAFILHTFLCFCIISCQQKQSKVFEETQGKELIISKMDSLVKIKDTTLFINSSEGEEVLLFINSMTKDSIITSEVMGEMGKSTYEFIFNKELKSAQCDTYRYAEPIYVNSEPRIISHTIQQLNLSSTIDKKLNNLFKNYKKILLPQLTTMQNHIDNNLLGTYKLIINKNDSDWRNMKEIKLIISKKSVNYIAKGYQLYQNFNLLAIGQKDSLVFTFEKANDNTGSWALEHTKDFGKLVFDGKKYVWSSPYLDISFTDGKKYSYELTKEK